MKKTIYIIAFIMLTVTGTVLVNSCRKENTHEAGRPDDLLLTAQKWYANQLSLARTPQEGDLDIASLKLDWSAAKISTNSKKQKVIGVRALASRSEYIEVNVVMVDGEPQGLFKRYVRTGYRNANLILYSSSGRLLNMGGYDPVKHVMILPKIKLQLSQSLTPMTRTTAVGDGTTDLEEVTIYGKAPGGDGGTTNPVPTNPFVTPPGYELPGGGAGGTGTTPPEGTGTAGSDGTEWESKGRFPGDLSCQSFKFQKVNTSNSMAAIVTGLPSAEFAVAGGGGSRSFPLSDIIVDVPIKLQSGKIIEPGYAAASAAEAANDAVKILGTLYAQGEKWKTATDATYQRDFITTMETFLKIAVPGARVQQRGSDTRAGVTPGAAKYDGFIDWVFGVDCK